VSTADSGRLRFSLRLNNDLPAAALVDLAIVAEQQGFDQLWISNDLLLRSAAVLVATIAARTTSLSFGIGVVNPYSVHVAELAMQAATLQEVSGGRFSLGIGAGAKEFLSWVGIDRARPVATTASAVTALRALLGHDDIDMALLPEWYGPQSSLKIPLLAPVPVYVGAMGPVMLAMAGQVADGALPLLYPPEYFTVARGQVLAGIAESGRDPIAFDLPACFWVSVSADAAAGRDALAEKLAYYGPSISAEQLAHAGLAPADFEPAARRAYRGESAAALITDRMLGLGIAGDPAAVVDRCRTLVGLGATHLSFGPPLGPDPVAAVELLGSTVLPTLRAPVGRTPADGRAPADDRTPADEGPR
jgi:5,10-methylenetetrahydromethanopterin reductase